LITKVSSKKQQKEDGKMLLLVVEAGVLQVDAEAVAAKLAQEEVISNSNTHRLLLPQKLKTSQRRSPSSLSSP